MLVEVGGLYMACATSDAIDTFLRAPTCRDRFSALSLRELPSLNHIRMNALRIGLRGSRTRSQLLLTPCEGSRGLGLSQPRESPKKYREEKITERCAMMRIRMFHGKH